MNAPVYAPPPPPAPPGYPQAPAVPGYAQQAQAPAAPGAPQMPPPPSPAALGVQPGYPTPPAPPGAPAAPPQYGTAPHTGGAAQGSTEGPDPRRVKTGKVRFHFFYVLTRDDKGKQRLTAMIPKSDVQTVAAINAAVIAAAQHKWGAQQPNWYSHPLQDGDLRIPNQKPPLPEYAGYYFMNVNGVQSQLVRVVNQYGHEITNPRDVKWGDWGRISISFYGSDRDNNIGVFATLNNVMVTDVGESLHRNGGGYTMAEDEFAQDFQQAPAGYQPPQHAPQVQQQPAQPQYAAPAAPAAPAQPVAGFAPPPPAPVAPQPPAASAVPPGAPMSPDGRYWWNAAGNQWVPL